MIESVLPSLQRALLQGAAVLLVGVAAWRWVILPRAAAEPGPSHRAGGPGTEVAGALRRAAGFGLVATLAALLAWALALVVQLAGFRDPFVPLREDLEFLIRETIWGSVWIAQGLVVLVVLVALLLARRPTSASSDVLHGGAWSAQALGAVALALTLTLVSHAMSAGNRMVAIVADFGHTLAAGAWIGTLATILVVARRFGSGPAANAGQFRAFSPVALVAVPLLVGLGLVLSWSYLTAVSDLWGTPYGRVLLAKIAVAIVVMAVGGINWRTGIPRIELHDVAASVRRRSRFEVAAAVIVLLLTGILTGTPRPTEGDMDDFDAFDEAAANGFPDPRPPPTFSYDQ